MPARACEDHLNDIAKNLNQIFVDLDACTCTCVQSCMKEHTKSMLGLAELSTMSKSDSKDSDITTSSIVVLIPVIDHACLNKKSKFV